MDYTLFVKNKFLNQSVGNFSQTFDKVSYNDFEEIVSKNTIFGMGKIALKICRKDVKSVFESVDGILLNQSFHNIPSEKPSFTRKDGYVDRDEMFQLLEDSYEAVYGQKSMKEKLSEMTVKEAIDLVIDYWNNL